MPEKNPMTHGSSVSAYPTTSSSASIAISTGVPPHRRLPATRNAAIREALSAWLDEQEQLAGLLEPHSPPAAVPGHLQQHPPPPRWRPHPSAAPTAPVASGAFRCRPGGPARRSARRPRGPQGAAPSTPKPRQTATRSMANSMSGSGGATERGCPSRVGSPPALTDSPRRVSPTSLQ